MCHSCRYCAVLQAVATQKAEAHIAGAMMSFQYGNQVHIAACQGSGNILAHNGTFLGKNFTGKHSDNRIFPVIRKMRQGEGCDIKLCRLHAALQAGIGRNRRNLFASLERIHTLMENSLRNKALQIVKNYQICLPAWSNGTHATQAVNTRSVDSCQAQSTHRLHA